MKNYLGSFTLRRQPRSAKRQAAPGAARFEPNWTVRFYLQGKEMLRSAKLYPVCDKCLACDDDPLTKRPGCECHKGASRWAESWLITQTALLQAGEMEKLAQLRSPVKWTPLAEVLKVYRERGPGDRVQRLNYLDSIFVQTTGRDARRMQWEDLTGDLLRDWAELRQEAGRRGWLGAGAGKNMPENGWEKLRALKAQNRLPALDTETEAEWNTTIVSYLTSVKSVFGENARARSLRGLRVPPLEDFLAVKLKKDLNTPEGHKEIPPKVMAAIEKGLAKLLLDDPRAWTFFSICDESGLRPVSVCRLGRDDLRMLDAGEASEVKRKMAQEWNVKEEALCDFGALLTVGSTKRGNPITTPLSAEVAGRALQLREADDVVWEAEARLQEVRRRIQQHQAEHGEADTSVDWRIVLSRAERRLRRARALLGIDVDKAYKRLNAWLRLQGLDGTQAAYLLRHRKGQAMRQFGGRTAVSAALGHKGEAMADRYSEDRRVVPAVFPGRKAVA